MLVYEGWDWMVCIKVGPNIYVSPLDKPVLTTGKIHALTPQIVDDSKKQGRISTNNAVSTTKTWGHITDTTRYRYSWIVMLGIGEAWAMVWGEIVCLNVR